MSSSDEREVLAIGDREVAVTNPRKVLFPEIGITKLDLARYYLSVADGALRAAGGRPNVLVRYPNGIGKEFFYQKRAPDSRPDWIDVVTLRFPSGRTAEEVVPRDAAALVWMANLACLELHPHPVRADDLDHPDELRVDLDPVPGVEWPQIQQVSGVVQAALADLGLIGWPKTSGSRGIHVSIRIERRWTFDQVRRAALALARDVERRAPRLATSKWWKEERHGVFLDYNQNAKDRTVAGAYSVRPKPDARVSAPLTWSEVGECDPRDFTLRTMPARFAAIGDRHAGIDDRPCSLEALLELSDRDEKEGIGDAPWPPHYRKQAGEPSRVAPSRARKPSTRTATPESSAAATTPTSSRRNSRTRSTSAQTIPQPPAAAGAAAARPTGRRTSTKPLLEIARARAKEDALAGLERWKARHPEAASQLEPADVLVDAMRGRFQTWTRIRVNLQHVPEAQRPAQEPLDPNEDPLTEDWEKAKSRR
jgi:DNA ligase D-like protein (predicted polymerase)